MLLNILIGNFSGMTIDELTCDPPKAIKYCDSIRRITKAKFLHDGIILKTLMNIRRGKGCPKNLKKNTSRKKLKTKLLELNVDLPAEEFEEIVLDAFAGMYRDATIDSICCFPRQALALCNYVKTKPKLSSVPIQLIMKTLQNIRKRGQ